MKAENTFIKSVHNQWIKNAKPHHEKNNNPFRGGTADVWYSGTKGDLWVEYKYLSYIPVRALFVPELSEQQAIWLNERFAEGRNVAVITGCKQGGVIFSNKHWEIPINKELFLKQLKTRKEIAEWILNRTGMCVKQRDYDPNT